MIIVVCRKFAIHSGKTWKETIVIGRTFLLLIIKFAVILFISVGGPLASGFLTLVNVSCRRLSVWYIFTTIRRCSVCLLSNKLSQFQWISVRWF